MSLTAERRPAGLHHGRLGARLLGVALLVLAGCAGPKPAAPVLPGFLEPAWLQAGSLDIQFTAVRQDAGAVPRTSEIHSVLTVGDGGTVTAMRTAQSTDGLVASSTEWHGGPVVESAETPSCTPATSEATVPPAVGELLASMFGPVDSATATGWSVDGSTASRPGSSAGVVERIQLTPLTQRTPREVDSASGAVVGQLTGIRIRHLDGSTAVNLPSCGQPDLK